MKKKVLFVLAFLLVAAGAAWWWFRAGDNDAADRIVLYGNIDIRDARLAFTEQERLADVRVEEGDRIEPGQVLATLQTNRLHMQWREAQAHEQVRTAVLRRLENGTRTQALEQARANVSAAEARRDNARDELDRLRTTARTGATSARELDAAEARLTIEQALLAVRTNDLSLAVEGPRDESLAEARAALEAARARRRLLEIRLADAVLKAPAAGTVISRVLEPGELATPARPVLVIALRDPKWVRVYLAEPDLGRVPRGMEARVVSDAYPDRTYPGWVGFISPVAEFTPKTVQTTELRTKLVYETRIHVDDPDDELRLGMPVTVTLPATPSPIRPGQRGASPAPAPHGERAAPKN